MGTQSRTATAYGEYEGATANAVAYEGSRLPFMSTLTNNEKKLKNCLQNKLLPRLARGFICYRLIHIFMI